MLNRDEVLELWNLVSFRRDHLVGVLQRWKTIQLLSTRNIYWHFYHIKSLNFFKVNFSNFRLFPALRRAWSFRMNSAEQSQKFICQTLLPLEWERRYHQHLFPLFSILR